MRMTCFVRMIDSHAHIQFNFYSERLNLIKRRFNLNSFRHVSCQMFFICSSFVCAHKLTYSIQREGRIATILQIEIKWDIRSAYYTHTPICSILGEMLRLNEVYAFKWNFCSNKPNLHIFDMIWYDAVLLVVFRMNIRMYCAVLRTKIKALSTWTSMWKWAIVLVALPRTIFDWCCYEPKHSQEMNITEISHTTHTLIGVYSSFLSFFRSLSKCILAVKCRQFVRIHKNTSKEFQNG